MKTSKTQIKYHIQASLNGGKWYDTDSKGFLSKEKAERQFDMTLSHAYPTWRGLRMNWRLIRRKTTVTTETEIAVFSTPSHGKKRILISELFVPSWLPKQQQARLKMRRIPGAGEQWQPGSQMPIL